MILNKGQMLTFAEGEYSDYCVNGLARVIKDFDIKRIQKQWESLHTELRENKGFHIIYERKTYTRKVTGMEFLPYLVKLGYVEDVDYIEIHTGCYGESDVVVDDERYE